MPENKELIPHQVELASSELGTGSRFNEVFRKMPELMQQAIVSLQLQDPQNADLVARTAEALYTSSKPNVSPQELILLRIFKQMVCVYAPLTRGSVFQMEGRFGRARAELTKGLTIVDAAIASSAEYAQLPNADEELRQILHQNLSVLRILFGGCDAAIRAEIVGYQGNIPKYKGLLREAVAEFRQVDQLPASLDAGFLTLAGMCTNLADRLETRSEVFDAQPGSRYLSPIGDKIFIIHGHDEAKWRELRDLLEDQLKLKTVVLKEEPGASETLIRKFEEYAEGCCYTFALLTPDDFVEKDGKSYFQARPNALFELGWFYGHFGRDHVCIVKKYKTEMPSDLAGILSIDFHEDISEGFMKIQDELERVGVIKLDKTK